MSTYIDTIQAAFLDELQKIAASKGSLNRLQLRIGRRPISVDKLLQRDKEGKLFKKLSGARRKAELPSRDGSDPNGGGQVREEGRDLPALVFGNADVLSLDSSSLVRP